MTAENTKTKLLPVVVQANWYQFEAGEQVRFPRVESRMLLWCKAGRGRIIVNGQVVPFTPGDYVMLPWRHRIAYEPDARSPFQVAGIHIIPHHDQRHPVSFEVAHVPTHPLADRRWRRDANVAELRDIVLGQFATHPALGHLAEYVVARFTFSRPPNEAEMRDLARLILAEVTRPPADGQSDYRALPNALSQMMQWTRDHLRQPADIEVLARKGGCSASTVRRLFHRHLNRSPLEWIARTKLDHAEQLLRSTSLRISEVAARVGFDDPYYFSRWFRHHRGLSPREARNQQVWL